MKHGPSYLAATAAAAILLASTWMAASPCGQTTAQQPATSAADDRAHELFIQTCNRCHDSARITAVRRTKTEWEEVINKMIERGATGSEDDFQTVFGYLRRHYGKVYINSPFNGRMRKLVMTATRNGYFFVLDRTNGQHLLTSRMGLVNNWAVGLDAKGQPKRNPNKDATIAGSLVNGDVLNYPPPTFSPDTGQFYVHEQNSMRISYLMEPDPRGSMGLGGTTGGGNLSWGTFIVALDYKTGKVTWRKELNGGSVGLLSTAGGLLFLSNGPNVEAWDAATGKGLWYSQIGGLSSPAETFMLDGKQHLLFTGANGLLYLFVLN